MTGAKWPKYSVPKQKQWSLCLPEEDKQVTKACARGTSRHCQREVWAAVEGIPVWDPTREEKSLRMDGERWMTMCVKHQAGS